MAVTIQVRRDTAANWTSHNSVLHSGEQGLETDTGKTKIGDGSTAWTSLAYTLLPLAQLDARYASVFSPMAFNAVGDGVANDTIPLQNCAAAAVAAKGVIDLGTRTFKTTSPISITTGFHMKAAGWLGGTIINSASDIFTVSGSVSYVTFEDCTLISNAGGGHIWNAGTGSMSLWRILGVQAQQNNAGKGIWNQAGGAWLDCLVGDWCNFQCVAGATVSPWRITGVAGNFNSVTFRDLLCQAHGATVPFFSVDPGATTGWNEDIKFEQVTWEVCTGGAVWMTAVVDVIIDTCNHWDTTATADIYHFAESSAGYPSRNIQVRGGRCGAVTGGAHNFFADPSSTNILIDSFGEWGTAPVISSPAAQTTIVNATVASGPSGITAPAIACSTLTVAGGAPIAPANDPMALGFTSTYISPNPVVSAQFTAGANSATYMRLRAGGYSISNLSFVVAASAGNISAGCYTSSGTGTLAKPAGGQLATSGAVATPATGYATVSLGATIAPNLGDWAAMSCDTSGTTAEFTCLATGSNTLLCAGAAWTQVSAHPLPSSPSSLSDNFYTVVLMRGS